MHTLNIALVAEAADVELPELLRVSAALQKQVIRDVLAAWGVRATVDAFASLEDVPNGFFPVPLTHEQARSLRALLVDAASQEYTWVEAVEVEELRAPSRPPPLGQRGRPRGQGSPIAQAWFGALGLVLVSAVGWVVVDGRAAPAPAAAAAPAPTRPHKVVPAQAVLAPERSASPALASAPAQAAPPAVPSPPTPVDAVVVADASARRGDTPPRRPERRRHRPAAPVQDPPPPASTPGEPPAPSIEAGAAPAPQAPPLTASFDALIESRR